jgi:hypothetical protein
MVPRRECLEDNSTRTWSATKRSWRNCKARTIGCSTVLSAACTDKTGFVMRSVRSTI